MESAGRDDDAALGVEVDDFTLGRDCANAGAGKSRRLQKLDGLRVEEERDVLGSLDGVKELRGELGAAGLLRTVDDVAAHGGGPGFFVHLLPLDADAVGQPLNAFAGLLDVHAGEFGIAAAHGDVHHVLVELVERVAQAVALLHEGVRGVEVAAGIDRVAERTEHFVEERDLGALVSGFKRGGKARTARAEHDDVEMHFGGSGGFGGGGVGDGGGAGGCGGHQAGFQKSAAVHVTNGHVVSPLILKEEFLQLESL